MYLDMVYLCITPDDFKAARTKDMSNQGEQLMVEGEQLAPASKGCSFHKSLFPLGKGANEISFIFTLSRGSIVV